MSAPGDARRTITAALLHAPGLRLLYGVRLGPRTGRENAFALGVTILAVAAVWLTTQRAFPAVGVWLLGHFSWSAWLSRRVWRGTADE